MIYREAVKFYIRDICYQPNRFDSWAGLALAELFLVIEALDSVRC